MHRLRRFWEHFEEAFIAFLLAAMTLVTFVYVVLNNLYPLFYAIGDAWEGGSALFLGIGDFLMELAQEMVWSVALTKMLFGWLIFFGISYGVRTAGHLGVDALVKLASRPAQRLLAVIACLCCMVYAGLFMVASFKWLMALIQAGIEAEDLDPFGIHLSHIAMIVPLGFALVLIRYLEIMWRILMRGQINLGLADEAAEASKLASHHEDQH
ncbi:TRAP transporter small permease [Pseudomonas chlororaphis]|uniref:TRAP transporter small permease n=1 Tax=Pseudomonas chlororaphis TaxID=587753 RepID=UPI0003D38D5F|nr:TRAP transporter small permease [Pseudomonas chlororaphis]AZD29257.1 TRAP-type transport system, small permease component, predicted N-acetylneuraminate transporter [Pseudomonas chlororaphis]ETD37870.1 C4-dicarboxylate ABC transporter [Pseudomonas chlororaphis subsp. aurantiaca PB-St2]QFS54764.1 TRAP transporter small permease subunit [Pseudomonas chlororaphis subsp. aurantiaca]